MLKSPLVPLVRSYLHHLFLTALYFISAMSMLKNLQNTTQLVDLMLKKYHKFCGKKKGRSRRGRRGREFVLPCTNSSEGGRRAAGCRGQEDGEAAVVSQRAGESHS